MLETKIQNLTDAILELTKVMTIASAEMKADATIIVEESIKAIEVVQVEVVEQTHDDIRAAILSANRADADNKKTIKALMETYGAKKVTDIKEADIAKFLEAMKGVIA